MELWRVLKPGGVGVIVYWWSEAPLAWRIEKLRVWASTAIPRITGPI
jgi:hypothetical protein